jgi:DUF305 family protein family protein
MNPRTVFTKAADIGSLGVGWLRSSQRRSLHEVNSRSETNIPMNFLTKLWAAFVACGFGASMIVQAGTYDHSSQSTAEPDWSELIASMKKMHMAMGAVQRSGNSDVDFVRLMLPHHQAAIDMAKTQLLYGKDAQMRRLAQEIITDQQLEIELMQHWLKRREPGQAKENQTPAVKAGKED